ncbi:hypothetical protein FQN54_006872 [Arachnomyces sp. PD_36]|nr:hypothetical protein FQN54_006872 [Arachnomyces sp. PD_36]
MKEPSDDPPLLDRIRSWTRSKPHVVGIDPSDPDDSNRGHHPTLPVANPPLEGHNGVSRSHQPDPSADPVKTTHSHHSAQKDAQAAHPASAAQRPPAPAAPPVAAEDGEKSPPLDPDPKPGLLTVFPRIFNTTKVIVRSSWINWLLLFVPVGLALGAMHRAMGHESPVSPTVVFSINAVAIIPLASLLGFATESVASKLGDKIGALMNVTFGNAVELIIFMYVLYAARRLPHCNPCKFPWLPHLDLQSLARARPVHSASAFSHNLASAIALVAGEIRIVQASLLGSILANLLLILGMCFLFGGLRFREQLYNSTITQMSACLLSLSVMSLLLPTAFHASFNNAETADRVVVKVSRGTSVVLLFVYVLYLLFQLKSHAYIYESTPQHMIDEESYPGVLAEMLNSSSSSSSGSSSDSDSDASSNSNTTAKRIKRALRRKRRKSGASSKDIRSVPSPSAHSFTRTASSGSNTIATMSAAEVNRAQVPESVISGDEADTDEAVNPGGPSHFTSRDFESERHPVEMGKKPTKKSKNKYRKQQKKEKRNGKDQNAEKNDKEQASGGPAQAPTASSSAGPQVDPAKDQQGENSKRPFNLRTLSYRPAIPRVLTSTVFSQPAPRGPGEEHLAPHNATRTHPDLRRANSMPDRLNRPVAHPSSAHPLPYIVPTNPPDAGDAEDELEDKAKISRTAAIILLLVSTGLVAACAEFLVESIDYLVENTNVSQAFIGLIILPIVGNAAEHATAVTVASKNKMDLAIGVALGSSIQIALFVTPIIVLLGWCLGKDMSLYFSLFETVSLFASAFIVNFLMLDGRSNYLEGALLIAAYVIISLAAFFYPPCENLSSASGIQDPRTCS